jgi:hypothetical protein
MKPSWVSTCSCIHLRIIPWSYGYISYITYIYMYICICIYICIYVYICICIYRCIYNICIAWMCIYIYSVYVYIYSHIVYKCMCIYIVYIHPYCINIISKQAIHQSSASFTSGPLSSGRRHHMMPSFFQTPWNCYGLWYVIVIHPWWVMNVMN